MGTADRSSPPAAGSVFCSLRCYLEGFGEGCSKARVRSSAAVLKSVAWRVGTIPNTATKILANKHQAGFRDRDQCSLPFSLLTWLGGCTLCLAQTALWTSRAPLSSYNLAVFAFSLFFFFFSKGQKLWEGEEIKM